MAYLDYNAGAPVHELVIKRMTEALAVVGNPSSVHQFGRKARRLMEDARSQIANAVGATPGQVIFTSGGTEANALAMAQAERNARLISATEHPSVLAYGSDQLIRVDMHGRIDLEHMRAQLGQGGRNLVSFAASNNETGVIQPVIDAVELAHDFGAHVHVDAVQMLGKGPCSIAEWGADSISLSAHKIGGPKGIGALVIRDGYPIEPILKGGGQELRRRAGTENIPGVVGFAAAVEAMGQLGDWQTRAQSLRDRVEKTIQDFAPEAVIFGQSADRICNTSALAMPGVKAETQLMAFDLEGIAVSAGSACSSGKVSASPVLTAMGAEQELASETIRMSLGWGTKEEDLDRFIDVWKALYNRHRGV